MTLVQPTPTSRSGASQKRGAISPRSPVTTSVRSASTSREPITPREGSRKWHVATPPVAAPQRDAVCFERCKTRAMEISEECRDLSELCKEAAAHEVASMFVGTETHPQEPAFQRAHAVAQLLLCDAPAESTSPPYLRRLWLLRRSRRRVRAMRQVKQVLSLRDEVVLSRVLSAWCSYSKLRRLVLCGRNIKEAGALKCADKCRREDTTCEWLVASPRRSSHKGRSSRRGRLDALAAVVRRGEAACRLVLLYASLHAWSDCRSTGVEMHGIRRRIDAGGTSRKAFIGQALLVAKNWPMVRRPMSALLAAWAHLTLQRRLHLADVRLAQENAELLRLQLLYGQLRQNEAQTFHDHRLVEGTFNAWLLILEVSRERRLYKRSRVAVARAPQRLRARFAAWRWLWEAGRKYWHMACAWHARGEQGRRKELLRRVVLSWYAAMQDAWCFRAFEEACAEKYAQTPSLARFGRYLHGQHSERSDLEETNSTPSETVLDSLEALLQDELQADDRTLTFSHSS